MTDFTWLERAESIIRAVDRRLPADTPLAERTREVDAACIFARGYYPYKAWLKARRAYLGRFGYRGRGAAAEPAPLERLMAGEARS